MNARAVTAYPWRALEAVTRRGRATATARRQVEAAIDTTRFAGALAELCDCDASLFLRRVSSDVPRRRPLAELAFELGSTGLACVLSVEPELAVNVLSRILRRPVTLTAHAALDDSLTGAFCAVVLELARRSGAQGALHLLDTSDAREKAHDVFVEATALIAGTPYQVVAALGVPAFGDSRPVHLAALGELPISLPVVIGLGLAERAALPDFSPGNAWFPGVGLWLGPEGDGPVALAASTRDEGVAAALSRDGQIVIRGEHVALPFEVALGDNRRDEPMSDSEKPDSAKLAEAVLDSPVVVRVEMGAISMTAREWAELGPGDVIETGRRIAEPVVLRVAGREVARGELVNLEGELGVRIRELVRS